MRTIIEMARQAGIRDWTCDSTKGCLGRFAAFVRADEREACAKVCDARYMGDNNREDAEAKRCAAAIRAKGEPTDCSRPTGFLRISSWAGKCVTARETAPKEST